MGLPFQAWFAGVHNIPFRPQLGESDRYAPNRMLTRGVYQNSDGHLPEAPGRVWYEADRGYTGGPRGAARILWSNDGLVFTTYDHYQTFYEIV